MPIYEYRCEHCGSHFDVLQRIGDDGKNLRCPKCGHERVEKQFSAFATAGADETHNVGSNRSCGSGGFS